MKRAIRLSVLGLVLALAAVAGFKLLRTLPFFAVRRVELVGARYITPSVMARALAIPKGASIFDAIASLERRAAGVSGVLEASVSWRLPGTIRVTVREADPVRTAGRLVVRAARLGVTG